MKQKKSLSVKFLKNNNKGVLFFFNFVVYLVRNILMIHIFR